MAPMNWIIFGDDWGAHPSTTQHLINHLPSDDKIIWINSIGSRAPTFSVGDLKRLISKLTQAVSAPQKTKTAPDDNASSSVRHLDASLRDFSLINPMVLPFHMNASTRKINRHLLSRKIRQSIAALGGKDYMVVISNPVAVEYIDDLPVDTVAYLRLDDYERLPGCDADLIRLTEDKMFERADTVFATARSLLPPEPWSDKGHYLPQGVNYEHFANASLDPSGKKVLGFFGLMAEWIDHELIDALAKMNPDWIFRFIGNVRFVHPSLLERPNIEMHSSVPFEDLPQIVADWSAAWIPFEVSELTRAVNPLKLREYLATGLPTHCTPLPEARELQERSDLFISDDPKEISDWLDGIMKTDTIDARRARRQSVKVDSWHQRSNELRDVLTSVSAA